MSPDETLRDLQRQFVREVLHRDAPGLHARIVADGLPAGRRLGIYRTTARENFALALESAFPLLLACLGPGEFRQLAWSYQRAHPSPSGNLFHVGRQLPGFLAARVAPEERHLVDVARLEWAIQEALVAADGPATLDFAALAAVPAGDLPTLRFRLHPSARLLVTTCAVFDLWEALQASRPLPPAVAGTEHLLVVRRAGGVELQRLPPADHAWLVAVGEGADFATAAAALPAAAREDLGALLVRAVAAGAVTSFA